VSGPVGRRVALLALAVVAYALAAWAVAPGFYDGIAPPQPYRWLSPPPQFRSTNQQPLSGHATIKVAANGVVDPGSVFTQDGQAAVSFVPGAFVTPPDRSPVTIDIKPQATFPDPGKVHIATNVYCVTSSSSLAAGKDVLVTLQFSTQIQAPSDVYEYQGDQPWRKLGNTGSAAPYYVASRATALGCFGAGVVGTSQAAASQGGQGGGGGQTLPIIVALAILVVVLAGIPLAVLRRRGSADDEDEDGEERS
jgi:hypothetical protein